MSSLRNVKSKDFDPAECSRTKGKLKLDELVTRRYALEQINEAVDDLEYGRILGCAIITHT